MNNQVPPHCPLQEQAERQALQAHTTTRRQRSTALDCTGCILASDCEALAAYRRALRKAIRQLGEEWNLEAIFGSRKDCE